MPVLKLSQHFVDNELRCPQGKNKIEFCDTELPGLYILVSAASPGCGAYFLRYKSAIGRTSHEKIARTTDIDLAEARRRARTLRARISLGGDPRGEARQQKGVPTFSEFFDDSYLPHIRVHKRSWKRDVELFARLRVVLGQQRLNQVSRQRVQQLHASLVEEAGLKPATADHVLKVARRMLSLAIEWGTIAGPNPLARIKMFNPDNRVDNHLDSVQLARLMSVLETDSNRTVCLICKWLLATGCRVNEALSATWGQVDRENGVWSIPASNSKSKRIRAVPIGGAAIEVLGQLKEGGDESYLFTNARTGSRYCTIAKSWERIRSKAGLPNVRLHDLRHTFASVLINAGESIFIVKELLGHSDTSVTERYLHVNRSALQAAANTASIAMREAKGKVA